MTAPPYSPREELANALTHGAGILASAAGAAVLVVLAAGNSATAVVAASVFGGSLILLYTASTLYHATRRSTTKVRLKVLDHCAIYILIAGTYPSRWWASEAPGGGACSALSGGSPRQAWSSSSSGPGAEGLDGALYRDGMAHRHRRRPHHPGTISPCAGLALRRRGGIHLGHALSGMSLCWRAACPTASRWECRWWDLPPRVVPHPMLVPAPVEGREGRASSGTRATLNRLRGRGKAAAGAVGSDGIVLGLHCSTSTAPAPTSRRSPRSTARP